MNTVAEKLTNMIGNGIRLGGGGTGSARDQLRLRVYVAEDAVPAVNALGISTYSSKLTGNTQQIIRAGELERVLGTDGAEQFYTALEALKTTKLGRG